MSPSKVASLSLYNDACFYKNGFEGGNEFARSEFYPSLADTGPKYKMSFANGYADAASSGRFVVLILYSLVSHCT